MFGPWTVTQFGFTVNKEKFVECTAILAYSGCTWWIFAVDIPLLPVPWFFRQPPEEAMASRHRLFRRGVGGVCGVLTLTIADLGREKV